MLWNDKLDEWKNNKPLTYPKNEISKRFFYETSILNNNGASKYNYKFIESDKLTNLKQDYKSFQKHIDKSDNKYVTSFANLSGDSILIIPIPRTNKNFTTIKDFIDNASLTQQRKFWHYASIEIRNLLKTQKNIYVSTHGLGVSYFHLRLDKYPKYYQTSEYK